MIPSNRPSVTNTKSIWLPTIPGSLASTSASRMLYTLLRLSHGSSPTARRICVIRRCGSATNCWPSTATRSTRWLKVTSSNCSERPDTRHWPCFYAVQVQFHFPSARIRLSWHLMHFVPAWCSSEVNEQPLEYVFDGSGTQLTAEDSVAVIADGLRSGRLLSQYELLPRSRLELSCSVAKHDDNIRKNRYGDIFPCKNFQQFFTSQFYFCF